MLAALAWVLLRQGDEVGVWVAHRFSPQRCPPRGIPSHLTEVLATLGAILPSGPTVVEPAVEDLVGTAKRKGVTVLASDLLFERRRTIEALRLLAARGHAVLVLHVLSPEERTFPFRGAVVFRSSETGESALMDTRGLRRPYLAALERFQTEVRDACHDAGVFFVPVDMARPPHETVAAVARAMGTGRRRRAI
jgi:uncharacterized protein (DUF58 family)